MRRRHDDGYTLIELLVCIVVLGIIMAPLTEFVMVYLKNTKTTQNRLADSHDLQIATAYFSQDVGDIGVRSTGSAPQYLFTQSVWTPTSGFPSGGYCGSASGTPTLLLEWDSSALGSPMGQTTSSVLYATESDGALHRLYCASGTSLTSDATLVHGLKGVAVSCSTTCTASTPPTTITLSLDIAAVTNDTAPLTAAKITGQRRQT